MTAVVLKTQTGHLRCWNRYHILKSLTYFDDAEEEPMPNMLVQIDWEEVKEYFTRTAASVL